MPIYPLPVLAEEAEEKARRALKPPKTMVVRYGAMFEIGEFPYSGDQVVGCGSKLIVKTPRGIEVGEMLTTTCENSGCGSSVSRKRMLQYITDSGGKQFPFTTNGRIERVATIDDLNEWSQIEYEKPAIIRVAKKTIKDMKLDMKLVDVEPLFDRERIIFYFAAEDRVDFRDLVKLLASELKVRVEMRQVGSRDEARLVADYEKCGQQCCCKQFLKVLKPVSMRSAKIQKATLDPAKISGRCGRLMCCLRYEDKTYDQLRKNLPHRKTRVMTEDGIGTVMNTQILTQLALVELDATRVRNAYPIENLETLTGDAAKFQSPPPPAPRGKDRRASTPPPKPAKPTKLVDEKPASDTPAEASTPTSDETAKSSSSSDRRSSSSSSSNRSRSRSRKRSTAKSRAQDKRSGNTTDDRRTEGEPRRPSPGNPLNSDEVKSREGQPSDKTDTPSDAKPQANSENADPNAPKKKRRRRRRRRGGKNSGSEGGGNSNGPNKSGGEGGSGNSGGGSGGSDGGGGGGE